MSETLLDVRGLEAGYGASRVLFGIDLQVAAGSVTALLGANGAGKTTTLRALCGLIRRQGRVTLAGQRIEGMATEEIVRLGVAHVPDGRGTFTGLTTEENLRMGACTRRDPPLRRATGAASSDVRHRDRPSRVRSSLARSPEVR